MNKFERIGLIVLFFISLIYSYVKPKAVVEEIKETKTISIYLEGKYQQKLIFDYKPTIKDVFDKANIINNYNFPQDYQLSDDTSLYIPLTNDLVSLNNASIEQLMTIPGVGQKRAEMIIEYRNKTPFKVIEDMMNVSGIGEKTYLKMREYVCL